RRLKEMAIRKIHGATANQIVMIFIRKVANWVVIGGCIGIPLGLLIVNRWLQTFAFRTNVGMLTVLLPFVATFLLIIASSLYYPVLLNRTDIVKIVRNDG